MSEDARTPEASQGGPETTPGATPPEPQAPATDEKGRRLFDENGQPIHWATPRERVTAFILALVVIAITIAVAYSLAVGDFIRW